MEQSQFRVLCIDGGGIRGIIPAIWLAQLEDDLREKGTSLAKTFDLICGTSTGSILAAAVATGVSMHQVITLFEDDGPRIFKRGPSFVPAMMSNLKRAKYNGNALSKALESVLGNRQMHDAQTSLCITTYDIENRKTVLIRSYDKNTKDVEIWEACKASSAAPTYFPPVKLKIGKARRILVDGGVAANNPSSLAIAEAIGISKKKSLSVLDSEIVLVSLGTGSSTRNLARRGVGPQGWFDWAGPVLDVMFDASASMSDHISKQILDPNKYFRFQFEMISGAGSDDLDNAEEENIESLKAAASTYLSHNAAEVYSAMFDLISEKRSPPKKPEPRSDIPTPE